MKIYIYQHYFLNYTYNLHLVHSVLTLYPSQYYSVVDPKIDFREGYDTTIYEVHKQYNLRSRRIDVPEDNKKKETKQPTKAKVMNPPVQTFPKTIHNPNHPIVEDVLDNQKPNI